MTTDPTPPPGAPTLADQLSRLYDLVAGYHATHLLEIARELGVWAALTASPGLTSDELAGHLGTDRFYTDVLCRTAFSFGLLAREGAGWRMGPHFDQILGDPDSSFHLACAPGCTWCWARTTRPTLSTSTTAAPAPTRSTARRSCARWPRPSRPCRGSSPTWSCPGCPASRRGCGRARGSWTSAAAAAG